MITDSLQELIEINASQEPIRARYRQLSSLFHRFINLSTSRVASGIELSGPFAKTDYLLKEADASKYIIGIVHDARNHFRHLATLTPEQQAEYYPGDLEAVARFISIVEKAELPTDLSRQFPEKRTRTTSGELAGDVMRFIVIDFDDRSITATSDKDPDRIYHIAYSTPSPAYPYDREYLYKILFKGAQINVIRPRIDNCIVYPELIIFEPDLLIDVSAVAACFESYATDARIALLKRISPPPAGDAINLGNFASQILDEEIHSGHSPMPYNESVMTFFRNNALPLAAIPPERSFHENAKKQRVNIHNALYRDLPSSFSGFNLEDVMVEPSFFSEMLGLQGRMDLLQLDFRILAEQKSGKGEWPYDNFISPRARTQHYVQLLLYMLIIRYNFRLRYEANHSRLDPFLLYSKYEKSLIALGFAPQLVFEALKIRNQIAALDIMYAEKGVDFLVDLTPEMLNRNPQSKLWQQFTRPQLSALLSPVAAVNPTERLYYLRFMRFIAKEHLLAKTGNRRKDNSGFASTWHSPLEEKLESGNIYCGLEIDERSLELSPVSEIRLIFREDERNVMANFRIGDVVILYSYPEGKEPDARGNMVFRSTIAEISAESIILRLRAPQSSKKPFLSTALFPAQRLLWAIEHDFVESSFTGLYRAMHSFLSAPAARRDLLMMRREPIVDPTIELNLKHGNFNELALRAKQARECFFIVGPPGTGKTSFGLMTSLREELSEPDSNVVILAFTNRAVDEICSKLGADGIDYIRLGSELSCSSDKDRLLCRITAGCRSAGEVRDLIARTRVFVATTTALNAGSLIFRIKHFSLAIIDEASQILEPHIMGLLSAVTEEGNPSIDRWIMIGDHKQLPAVVQQTPQDSRVDEPELQAIGLTDCSLSLFERMLRRYGKNPHLCFMLTSQGRMHEEIADFPNKAFYQGKLSVVPLPHQIASLPACPEKDMSIREIIFSHRVAFIDVRKKQRGLSDKINLDEAVVIARIVKEIREADPDRFDPDRTVGIIVPYRNQIAAIRNEIGKLGVPVLGSITIDTIERYQGSQRKYIIYGFTVSHRYQLDFLTNQTFKEGDTLIDRKLNVAMTRAEEHLLLVGNAPLLRSNEVFRSLMAYLEKRHSLFQV